MMHLILEIISWYSLDMNTVLWKPTNHKLQVSSIRSFKILQMIKSSICIIKLLLNFDVSSIFNIEGPRYA
jgi:hypothetical protein